MVTHPDIEHIERTGYPPGEPRPEIKGTVRVTGTCDFDVYGPMSEIGEGIQLYTKAAQLIDIEIDNLKRGPFEPDE